MAVFFFLKIRRYLPERARGADLAPAETILFVQAPNLRQTALRFPNTDLYQIWREPEVQAFLEKPRHHAPWMREWARRFEEIARVAPGEFFLAVTSAEKSNPSFVAGCSFAGSRSQAATLAADLRGRHFPKGNVVATAENGNGEVETFRLPDGRELLSCIRGNWYLAASSRALLDETLARFEGKAGASLATVDAFQRTMTGLGSGQDLLVYGKPGAVFGGLLAGSSDPETKPGSPAPMAIGSMIDGTQFHERVFFQNESASSPGKLSHSTLKLAPQQTLAYYATNLGPLRSPGESFPGSGLLPNAASFEKALSDHGLKWDDLSLAIGPEVGFVLEWPENAAFPTLLVAVEIRDAEKTRAFADAITDRVALGSAWQSVQQDGVEIRSAPPQAFSFVRPALAITERFALVGLSSEAVTTALSRLKASGSSLEHNPAFQEVSRPFPADASAVGYLDFQSLFERGYRMARPFITLSLAFSAEGNAQFDAGKLPPVESLSKHLGPTGLSQRTTPEGTLIDSIGSIGFAPIFLGAAWGGMANAGANLEGLLPGGLGRAGAKRRQPDPARHPNSSTPAPSKSPAKH